MRKSRFAVPNASSPAHRPVRWTITFGQQRRHGFVPFELLGKEDIGQAQGQNLDVRVDHQIAGIRSATANGATRPDWMVAWTISGIAADGSPTVRRTPYRMAYPLSRIGGTAIAWPGIVFRPGRDRRRQRSARPRREECFPLHCGRAISG